MVARVFKISSIVLFCITFALAIATRISIGANDEAGGWLLLATAVIGVATIIFAIVAIVLGKGSIMDKLSKMYIFAYPFLAVLVIIGFLILMWTPVIILCIYSMIIWL